MRHEAYMREADKVAQASVDLFGLAPAVTSFTKLPALALAMSLLGTMATADPPPPVPDGGLIFIMEGECTDNETGQAGYCYISMDKTGKRYLAFYQDDVLMLIRQVLSQDDYETIWVNPLYVSV